MVDRDLREPELGRGQVPPIQLDGPLEIPVKTDPQSRTLEASRWKAVEWELELCVTEVLVGGCLREEEGVDDYVRRQVQEDLEGAGGGTVRVDGTWELDPECRMERLSW